MNKLMLTTLATATLSLAACGGSDSNDTNDVAQFSLGISDAPVDNAESVVACFNAIELTGNGDSPRTFTVGEDIEAPEENDLCTNEEGQPIANTIGINLLEFTGNDSMMFLEDAEIEAGQYGQLRLVMADGSYIMADTNSDGEAEKVSVQVPSNELKLDGFIADAGGNLNFTVEFDLRNSMTNPVGQSHYILKPRGVRLVDNSTVGHLKGTVAEGALLFNNTCTVAPENTEEPVAYVYLYEGSDLDEATLADNGGAEENTPYASTAVYFDGVNTYDFSLGFIAAGDYTAALTCNGNDDPEADDDINFFLTEDVSIEASSEPQELEFIGAASE
ncbi:DUF4382 domain-containing protein [Idiomarina sp. M1R2S28]|uniref:DUF4382 domain-containing protein n=1 Tax=Idiomarina rhizosphaerae TaxID=2961572 RepID=A0A9X2G2K7_9GAMM|nr:DUF4382 domain-containing protein [Idiomarina rhizosphaerae]MCP1338778.1 DUF4382 domain-containing protein [Idiomarina rhizosphaerae]